MPPLDNISFFLLAFLIFQLLLTSTASQIVDQCLNSEMSDTIPLVIAARYGRLEIVRTLVCIPSSLIRNHIVSAQNGRRSPSCRSRQIRRGNNR